MSHMTMKQIEKIFDDMGLGTQAERERFADFVTKGTMESRSFDFIRIDNVSTSGSKEEDDGKLASTS